MSIVDDLEAGLAAALDGRDPDADLVGVLDAIDPTDLTGEALAAYVRGRWRAHNRAEAQLLVGLRELGIAKAETTGRLASSDEFSGDEVAALLGWSRTMASRRLDLADDLFERLPALGEALWRGELDEPKVRAISELTTDLSQDHARHAVGEVLPDAAGLPVAMLRERLEEIVLAIDPEWAERRRRRAEARGRVLLTANPAGTATLSFVDAPAEDGIDSNARIDALAAAARQLGVLTPINQLRLQVGMRLLNGSTAGITDRDIAVQLAAEYHAASTIADDDSPDDGRPDDGGPDGPDDGPHDDGPHDDGPHDDGPHDDGPHDDGPHDDGPHDDGPHDGVPDGGAPDDGSSPDAGPCGDPEDPPDDAADENARQGALDLPDLLGDPDEDEPVARERRAGRIRQGAVEVRLRLTTALGLDEHPATVPGYGAVTAPLARDLLAARHDGEWRVVLTTPDGHLHHVLLARRRPTRPPGPRGPHRARGQRAPGAVRCGAIVELQVPTTLLHGLDPADHPGWGDLLAELRHRVDDLEATGQLGRPPDADAEPDRWRRRRAGAEAERWVRARDRACVAPWCGRSAHRAEIDHTWDHAAGGPTLTWNLGAWCTHDHRAKHLAGWTVRQTRPGRFVIRTRAGVTHTFGPRTILRSLPDPRPAGRPRPLPDDGPTIVDDDDDPDWLAKIAPRLAPRSHARPAPTPTAADDLPPLIDDPPPF